MKHGIAFILTGLISISVMAALGFFLKSPTESTQTETVDESQLQQAYMEREATYQAIIADANQQLEQANLDLQALSNRVTQLQQAQPVNTSVSATQYPISEAQAIEIASEVTTDEDKVTDPKAELVDFEGSVAYEVIFNGGPVYVDASNGSILYNSVDDTAGQHPISLDEAAKIASDYLGIYDIYQVDQITFNGRILIRVIFTQGHMVYLDQSGQIVYVQKVSRYDASNAVSVSSSSNDGGSSHSDEHEDHDDDDDDD
jgi:uncharacterized membrane protein YkoI